MPKTSTANYQCFDIHDYDDDTDHDTDDDTDGDIDDDINDDTDDDTDDDGRWNRRPLGCPRGLPCLPAKLSTRVLKPQRRFCFFISEADVHYTNIFAPTN